jgi:Tfp pilus assembly protein PilE
MRNKGLTVIEVVLYLALLGILISTLIPAIFNILLIVQTQQQQAESDAQFISIVRQIEAFVRTEKTNDISSVLESYSDIISEIDVNETSTQLEISFVYDKQMYFYVYKK